MKDKDKIIVRIEDQAGYAKYYYFTEDQYEMIAWLVDKYYLDINIEKVDENAIIDIEF